MRRSSIFAVKSAFFLCCLSHALQAMQLKPLSVEFSPAGKDAVRSFIVRNDQDEPAAVLISMAKRDVDLEGRESNPEVEDDFSIYPSQLILMPDEEQTIQVTWLGSPALAAELSYRLIAEQVSVDLDPEKKEASGLKILLKYIAAVYVTPPQVSPEVIVEGASVEKNAQGERLLKLSLWNRGRVHQVLRQAAVEVKAKEGASPLKEGIAEKIKDAILEKTKGTNMLANLRRSFSIPLPDEVEDEQLEISITFSDRR